MTITSVTVVQGVALQPGPKGEQGEQGPPGAIATLDVVRGWNSVQYAVPTPLTYVAGGTTEWDVSTHQSATLAISGGNTTMLSTS